jgi:hypothetical protein
VLIFEIISSGKEDEVRPTFASTPNIALYGVRLKPIVSKEFNSCGQMDLIDMQSLSYNDYRYIMVYQDHMTIFVVLWPLK